jgi:UDP-glucose 4-epimerase
MLRGPCACSEKRITRKRTCLLPRLFEAALHAEREFQIYGSDYPTADGSCIRDYVHVLDIARAHEMALNHLARVGFDVYNIGHCRGYPVKQVVREVERTTGRRIRAVFGPRRPGDPAIVLAKPTKIKATYTSRWCPLFTGKS